MCKLNECFSGPKKGHNDLIFKVGDRIILNNNTNNDITNTLANDTQGTISYWAYLDVDNDDNNLPLSFREASGNITGIFCNHNGAGNSFYCTLYVDNTKQWQIGHITRLRTAGMEDIVID